MSSKDINNLAPSRHNRGMQLVMLTIQAIRLEAEFLSDDSVDDAVCQGPSMC